MKGLFALRTIGDLFAKLEVDLERVRANSVDSYAAFDFCVTAWHLSTGNGRIQATQPVLPS